VPKFCLSSFQQPGHCTNILRPFEYAGIRTIQLTHTSTEFIDRLVFVRLEPSDEFFFERGKVRNAMAQEGRTDHCDVCASHQELDDVGRIMDATCSRQISLSFSVQNSYPAQG